MLLVKVDSEFIMRNMRENPAYFPTEEDMWTLAFDGWVLIDYEKKVFEKREAR